MYRASCCKEMHNSYNKFLFRTFLSALHVSNESSPSSSGARHNILHYTVYYAVLLMMNGPDSFETCRADKKLWNKIDYKNCASRWSSTRCIINIFYLRILQCIHVISKELPKLYCYSCQYNQCLISSSFLHSHFLGWPY